jgi:hypothetical protein
MKPTIQWEYAAVKWRREPKSMKPNAKYRLLHRIVGRGGAAADFRGKNARQAGAPAKGKIEIATPTR